MRQLILATFLILNGCATSATHPHLPALEKTYSVGDARIGSYVSSWKGFRTSSYWIEGPTGLIMIDTQFLLSAAEEALAMAESSTGKKVQLAIVLHPNPDKFNGTSLYQRRGIKVFTSKQVADLIPAVHQLRTEWFYERFKPDYPSEVAKPEVFGDKTTDLTAGGVTVKAHVLGRGCSGAHVVVEYAGNVFVGDLVTIGFHSWLELGYLKEWIQRVDEIRALKPEYVRTGRGGSGTSGALADETEYLQAVVDVIRAQKRKHGSKARLTEEISDQIVNEIKKRYPSYFFPLFVENGIEEAWKNL